MPGPLFYILLPLFFTCGKYLYPRLDYLGAFRFSTKPISHYVSPDNFFVIPEIIQAEDLAVHEPSSLIILLAQEREQEKYGWWPAWALFEKPEEGMTARAKLWALNTTTWQPTEFAMEYDLPFTVHGIDIWPTKDDRSFYLHAVNHPPKTVNGQPTDQADSRIEIFKVDLDSMTATHEQTLLHPLIKMPNDIISLGPAEFLVTNDHHHTRGIRRTLEDVLDLGVISWTDIVHIDATGSHTPLYSERTQVVMDKTGRVAGKPVATGLHNANGLGRGRNGEIVLGDASGGKLTTFTWDAATRTLIDQHPINVKVNLDNPVWFDDPYATALSNASAYVLAGLLSGVHLDKQARDVNSRIPSSVYLVRERDDRTEKKLLFEDDGEFISGAATACVVSVPPNKDQGSKRREGWVVVTGPWSRGVGVVKVDLTDWAKK